jgi:hypothetical protein
MVRNYKPFGLVVLLIWLFRVVAVLMALSSLVFYILSNRVQLVRFVNLAHAEMILTQYSPNVLYTTSSPSRLQSRSSFTSLSLPDKAWTGSTTL